MSPNKEGTSAKMSVEGDTAQDNDQIPQRSEDRASNPEASPSHEGPAPTTDRQAIIVDLTSSPKSDSPSADALNEKADARSEDTLLPSVVREAQNITISRSSAPPALGIAREAHAGTDGVNVPAAARTEDVSAPQTNIPVMHRWTTRFSHRGGPRKHFQGFMPFSNPLPTSWSTIPVDQLARYYPNHFSGHILRRFVDAGWSDLDITRAMHPDAQMQIAATGANFLRKYLIKEKKIMKEEQEGRTPLGLGFIEADIPHPAPNWHRPHEIAYWRQSQNQASTNTQTNGAPPNLRRISQAQAGRSTAHQSSQTSRRTTLPPNHRARSYSPSQPNTTSLSRENLRSYLSRLTNSSSDTISTEHPTPPREDVFHVMVRIWRNRRLQCPISDEQLSRDIFREYGWSPLELDPYQEPSNPERSMLSSNLMLLSFISNLSDNSSANWPMGLFETIAMTGQLVVSRASEENQPMATDRDSTAPVFHYFSPSVPQSSTHPNPLAVAAPSIPIEADNQPTQASDDESEEGSIPAVRPE